MSALEMLEDDATMQGGMDDDELGAKGKVVRAAAKSHKKTSVIDDAAESDEDGAGDDSSEDEDGDGGSDDVSEDEGEEDDDDEDDDEEEDDDDDDEGEDEDGGTDGDDGEGDDGGDGDGDGADADEKGGGAGKRGAVGAGSVGMLKPVPDPSSRLVGDGNGAGADKGKGKGPGKGRGGKGGRAGSGGGKGRGRGGGRARSSPGASAKSSSVRGHSKGTRDKQPKKVRKQRTPEEESAAERKRLEKDAKAAAKAEAARAERNKWCAEANAVIGGNEHVIRIGDTAAKSVKPPGVPNVFISGLDVEGSIGRLFDAMPVGADGTGLVLCGGRCVYPEQNDAIRRLAVVCRDGTVAASVWKALERIALSAVSLLRGVVRKGGYWPCVPAAGDVSAKPVPKGELRTRGVWMLMIALKDCGASLPVAVSKLLGVDLRVSERMLRSACATVLLQDRCFLRFAHANPSDEGFGTFDSCASPPGSHHVFILSGDLSGLHVVEAQETAESTVGSQRLSGSAYVMVWGSWGVTTTLSLSAAGGSSKKASAKTAKGGKGRKSNDAPVGPGLVGESPWDEDELKRAAASRARDHEPAAGPAHNASPDDAGESDAVAVDPEPPVVDASIFPWLRVMEGPTKSLGALGGANRGIALRKLAPGFALDSKSLPRFATVAVRSAGIVSAAFAATVGGTGSVDPNDVVRLAMAACRLVLPNSAMEAIAGRADEKQRLELALAFCDYYSSAKPGPGLSKKVLDALRVGVVAPPGQEHALINKEYGVAATGVVCAASTRVVFSDKVVRAAEAAYAKQWGDKAAPVRLLVGGSGSHYADWFSLHPNEARAGTSDSMTKIVFELLPDVFGAVPLPWFRVGEEGDWKRLNNPVAGILLTWGVRANISLEKTPFGDSDAIAACLAAESEQTRVDELAEYLLQRAPHAVRQSALARPGDRSVLYRLVATAIAAPSHFGPWGVDVRKASVDAAIPLENVVCSVAMVVGFLTDVVGLLSEAFIGGREDGVLHVLAGYLVVAIRDAAAVDQSPSHTPASFLVDALSRMGVVLGGDDPQAGLPAAWEWITAAMHWVVSQLAVLADLGRHLKEAMVAGAELASRPGVAHDDDAAARKRKAAEEEEAARKKKALEDEAAHKKKAADEEEAARKKKAAEEEEAARKKKAAEEEEAARKKKAVEEEEEAAARKKRGRDDDDADADDANAQKRRRTGVRIVVEYDDEPGKEDVASAIEDVWKVAFPPGGPADVSGMHGQLIGIPFSVGLTSARKCALVSMGDVPWSCVVYQAEPAHLSSGVPCVLFASSFDFGVGFKHATARRAKSLIVAASGVDGARDALDAIKSKFPMCAFTKL